MYLLHHFIFCSGHPDSDFTHKKCGCGRRVPDPQSPLLEYSTLTGCTCGQIGKCIIMAAVTMQGQTDVQWAWQPAVALDQTDHPLVGTVGYVLSVIALMYLWL